MKFRHKRGLSELITTVLLLLLTITSIIILSAVILPFIKNKLSEGEGCFNIMNKVTINDEKSCYTSPSQTKVRVRFGNTDVNEIYLILETTGGNTKQYILKEGGKNLDVNDNAIISLPQKGGGEADYTINTLSKTASVGVIINGNACQASDSIDLYPCE